LILGKDIFVGFLTVAVIAIAAETLRRTAVGTRASAALRFVERWNDPKLGELRTDWYEIYYKLKELEPTEVVMYLDENMRRKTVVTDVLNFCEEIAHAVNVKVADETLIRQLLGGTIRDYYLTLLPWIKIRQTTRPDAWKAIELMLDHWPPKAGGASPAEL
jgi:hypothetical protein